MFRSFERKPGFQSYLQFRGENQNSYSNFKKIVTPPVFSPLHKDSPKIRAKIFLNSLHLVHTTVLRLVLHCSAEDHIGYPSSSSSSPKQRRFREEITAAPLSFAHKSFRLRCTAIRNHCLSFGFASEDTTSFLIVATPNPLTTSYIFF